MAYSHESTTSLDRNKILLEADEFIAKYDLADSRNIIRKGVLLFYYLDDRSRIEEETIYLEDCKDMPTNNSPLTGMGICYAAGFLSLMVSRPCPEWGWVWLPPQPDGITRALHRYIIGQTRTDGISRTLIFSLAKCPLYLHFWASGSHCFPISTGEGVWLGVWEHILHSALQLRRLSRTTGSRYFF